MNPQTRSAVDVKRLLAAGLVLAQILACASQRSLLPVPEALLQEDPFDANYKIHCDKVSGSTVCVMTGNALRPFTPRYPMVSLGAVSEVDQGGGQRFFLRAVYVNEGNLLEIGPGKTMRLVLDGRLVELAGEGSRDTRYAGEGGKVYEVALYEVSREIVKGIAAAETVTVTIQGAFLLEKRFSPVNKLYFHQFVRHYVEKRPTR